jgi:hypothetical protein
LGIGFPLFPVRNHLRERVDESWSLNRLYFKKLCVNATSLLAGDSRQPG